MGVPDAFEKKSLASNQGRRKNHQPLPWKRSVPDLVTMLTTVPPLLPYSAEKLLFWTVNSCRPSTEGIYRPEVEPPSPPSGVVTSEPSSRNSAVA